MTRAAAAMLGLTSVVALLSALDAPVIPAAAPTCDKAPVNPCHLVNCNRPDTKRIV